MKLLIIGANGFIGNACYNELKKSHEVTGTDLATGSDKTILVIEKNRGIRQLLSEQKYDVVINCGGSSNVSGSLSNPSHDFHCNVTQTEELLNTIREISPDTRIIGLSSAAVYGDPETLPVNEQHRITPLSPYGLNKYLGEQLMSCYSRFYGLKTVSLRIFSAYGPGLRRQLFYDLYQKFNNGTDVVLSGTGRESRDFIFIGDIVTAVETVMRNASFTGEVYNLAGGEETTVHYAAELFAEAGGFDTAFRFDNKQFPGYPLNWRADIRKISALGFSPVTGLREGLTKYLTWLRNL